jgi:hypothetical protein
MRIYIFHTAGKVENGFHAAGRLGDVFQTAGRKEDVPNRWQSRNVFQTTGRVG